MAENTLYIGNTLITSSDVEEVVPKYKVSVLKDEDLPEFGEIQSITSDITSLGSYLFAGQDIGESFVVPEGITSIDNGCFSGCSSLKTITLPTTLKSLGISCFNGCYNLESILVPGSQEKVSLPESLEHIGSSCFNGCTSLRGHLVIPSLIKVLPPGCFETCEFTGVTLPPSLEVIGHHCFDSAMCMENRMVLPSSIKRIGAYAFYYCNGLSQGGVTSLTIPESVEYIGEHAFDQTAFDEVNDIWFEGNLPEIGQGAFDNLMYRWEYLPDNVIKVCVTVHYPANNASWSSDAIANLMHKDYESDVFSFCGLPNGTDQSIDYSTGESVTYIYSTEFISY